MGAMVRHFVNVSGHPAPSRDSRGGRTPPKVFGVVSLLRSSLLLLAGAAGDAGNEVRRSSGEELELRPLQGAQLCCEAGPGDPLAQQSNGGLMLGSGVLRRCNGQAGIAEEAMDGFAHQLADFEIVEKTEIAVGRR